LNSQKICNPTNQHLLRRWF